MWRKCQFQRPSHNKNHRRQRNTRFIGDDDCFSFKNDIWDSRRKRTSQFIGVVKSMPIRQ